MGAGYEGRPGGGDNPNTPFKGKFVDWYSN